MKNSAIQNLFHAAFLSAVLFVSGCFETFGEEPDDPIAMRMPPVLAPGKQDSPGWVAVNDEAAQEPLIDSSETETPKAIGYRTEQMDVADIRSLLQNLQPYQRLILEKLNRADRLHLPKLKAIVFPERWEKDELLYSPLPRQYPWAEKYAKALVIDQPMQAFAAYEQGKLVRWGPVSTGRRNDQTPSGLFHLNWKSLGRHSTVNPRWYMPWYFNFHNRRGLSLHAYSMPGYPASHACVRLLETDARWLYYWGEQYKVADDGQTVLEYGTPLLIRGRYDFASPPPWRSPAFLNQSGAR
ncbi:MAG: L,D-transpeptidase [Gammaproteobacteria bacterium]